MQKNNISNIQTNSGLIFLDLEIQKEYNLTEEQMKACDVIACTSQLELFLKYTEYLVGIEYTSKIKHFPTNKNISKDALKVLKWAYSRYRLYKAENDLLKVKEFIRKEEVLNEPQQNIIYQDIGLNNSKKLSAYSMVINTICLLYIFPNIFKEDNFTLDFVVNHIMKLKDDEDAFIEDATKNSGKLYLIWFNSQSSNLYRYLFRLNL